MNSAVTRIGGAFAVCVAKFGQAAVFSNPVILLVAGITLVGVAISDVVKES